MVFGTLLLTGVHPFRRMLDLPGPRGWMALMFLLIILVAQPVWVSFHSSVGITLRTGTTDQWCCAILMGTSYDWGSTLPFAFRRLQSWRRCRSSCSRIDARNAEYELMLKGFFTPLFRDYPEWIEQKEQFKEIADKNKWVELTTYVGVIGGAGFDYMAYTTWL